MADVGLLSLVDAHLKVDGVADDIYLGWIEAVEDVTVVPVSVSYGILVLCQTLVEIRLIVDIAIFFMSSKRDR